MIAAIVVIALVASIVGFCTYKAQLWGGKTVPTPSDLGVVKSDKTDEFSATDIEKSLHKRGFKTVTKQTFSAKPRGSFLKYSGIESSKRYSTSSQPVTIVASSGPGVPVGTSGKPAQNVTDSLKSMSVPVHYHKVAVSANGKIKEGTVVATSPAEGSAVTDTKQGIDVAVAETGVDGIGYDVIGTNKDDAEQQYTDKGFHVWMAPRFSSKKMLGKIVDSQPKPGSQATGGNLILFYGIDASGMDKAVQGDNDNYSVYAPAAPVGGTYCTKSGKCINLDEKVEPPSSSSSEDYAPWFSTASQVKSSEDTDNGSSDATGLGHELLFCHTGGDPGCASRAHKDDYGTRNELYYQNYGAFELMDSSISQITCGDSAIGRWDPIDVCVNGQLADRSYSDDNPKLSGASYEMRTHYVYFPVGSDVKGVVDSGYFDKAYVDKAKTQKAVDTSRPFFIRRDKTLYKTTKVDVPSLKTLNPFVPENGDEHSKGSKPVPTKPAPSDETAYYLIDAPQLDWASLPEFTISKDGSKADPKPTTKNATPDQITTAAEKGDFSLIAGKYCTIGNDCIDLSKTGMLTGGKQHASSQLHLGAKGEMWADTAHNVDPASQYLNLLGSDSEYSCGTATGAVCKDHIPLSDIIWPTDMIYVFKNADTSTWYTRQDDGHSPLWDAYNTQDALTRSKPASTTRPYLYPLGYHMNPSPTDSSVYYLQE
ncbi:hypothetical protein [Bifidobacterium sp. ESL0732]|uniref:hypothetical protein n=1 Tax=Bifidobacterium sp. ESL0732 TaxID=2983222 RepID=UPI0023F63A29|nr:hypothetical protein [Bifidobacterium sp. ESL0732]WEV64005.1 hypothetical protein OZX70_08835 [Bifidobacterium sp. ESL0732]